MSDDRPWGQMDELFERARMLRGSERTSYLRKACGDDEVLRSDVLSLLALEDDATPPDLLESGTSASGTGTGVDHEAEDDIPEEIGHYRILGRISAGGMGVVYRAEQSTPQRTVALKVLRRGLESANARQRFQYEIAILARLQHPGIAQIFDAGEAQVGDSTLPYFAMEIVEGEPIARSEPGQIPAIEPAIKLFARVCDAVQHAHRRGVIHRDIKPSNILVDRSGQPKVLDFGIAKAVEDDEQDEAQTETGRVVGSLWYLSPEQIHGDVDTRSDVYSLGVVLYQLLSGVVPYRPRNSMVHEVMRAIEQDDPVPLGQRDRRLAGDLEVIIDKAMAKDRDRRYGSAAELADDLRRFLRHEVIHARRATLWARAKKFARRRRALVGGVLATTVALILGLVSTLRFYDLHLSAKEEASVAMDVAELEQDKFIALRDFESIAELTERAKTLWPRHPDRLPDMDRWLGDAHDVLEVFPKHQIFIDELRRDHGEERELTWVFENADFGWLHGKYVDLAAEFEQLQGVLIPEIEERRRIADSMVRDTYEAYEEEWETCLSEIMLSNRHYRRIEFDYQIGLVPLEPDPKTGYWEFWLPETGDRPERDHQTDEWIIRPTTGMVLILLPGGKAQNGSQKHNPTGRNFDPHGHMWEIRRRCELDPFFISKYEMTQSQWIRIMGSNPSEFCDNPSSIGSLRAHHPVESVSWHDSVDALRRYGLHLPTENQWEYATRGGTETAWWCGASIEVFDPPIPDNVADESAKRFENTPIWWGPFAPFEDGASNHGGVAQWQPNGFGLFGTIGNVREWCEDWSDHIRTPRDRDGDGLRLVPEELQRKKIVKGGSFDRALVAARSSHREEADPWTREESLGVRPARAVLPSIW